MRTELSAKASGGSAFRFVALGCNYGSFNSRPVHHRLSFETDAVCCALRKMTIWLPLAPTLYIISLFAPSAEH